jgi:hypothetical protein
VWCVRVDVRLVLGSGSRRGSAGVVGTGGRGAGDACGGASMSLDRALSNATMYRQVYVWAHDKDVGEWWYARTNASAAVAAHFGMSEGEATGMECVTVKYRAGIDLPEPLKSFLVLLALRWRSRW